jgi:hypothetical protein
MGISIFDTWFAVPRAVHFLENHIFMISLNATINGHECHVSVIPYYVPNPLREYNWFIFKFNTRILEIGPSFLIIEYFENEIGEWEWRIVPNSPIQNREDLLRAAGEFIDNYYEDENNFK